ncbi:MAG: 50S ribosomal protein L19 [Bacilli bacterium]|nr:50S ribosomal protein L19 [Bacillales bacterium]MDY2574429.1 50S ribosomal protein L19 [Bacilli bacterium]
MNNQLVETITKSQIRTDLPKFVTGDTIKVSVRIVENGKQRIQVFQGVVIARRGSGVGETFIVRKMSSGVGVERTFPVNSPVISSIEVVKHGKVRRKKIYFLRSRSGKSARLKEVL